MTLKTSADGGPTTSPGSPLYSSVVFTLGQSFLLFRLNILGCKLNPILTFPPPGKMKDFFSRLCIVRGCFVSLGRRRRQQPRSSSSSPFPEDFRKGLCSPSGKDKLQLVPTGHGSLTGFVLAVKGNVMVWAFKSIQTAVQFSKLDIITSFIAQGTFS